MNPKITADHLRRRALVYVRQSTMAQVHGHLESQRRQYGLAEHAQRLGFAAVEVIDDDLGRSGSGAVDRPGFQRLVATVCTGDVGAVFCIEASRLARNGRDWHHLVDLCGLVGAVVVDPDGVYDPRLVNDRLLLGLKGSLAEFELSLLRQRSLESIRSKARRGELPLALPVGLCWGPSERVELDPDLRIQEAIRLVFRKFAELGSARQTQLWFREHQVAVPVLLRCRATRPLPWRLPSYHNIHGILTNPLYAGAYVYGRTEGRTRVVGDRARKTEGHRKPQQAWTVLIRDRHPGYISWDEFERIQRLLTENAHMKARAAKKSGRGGRALLTGLLRCRRCGRPMRVAYPQASGIEVVRYHCVGDQMRKGRDRCLSFGGKAVDLAVQAAILDAVSGPVLQAALRAAEQVTEDRSAQQRALSLELEQARYEARLAERRYEAVDPDNRLVASQLEARWNAALAHVRELEERLAVFDASQRATVIPDRARLLALASDLPGVWSAPATDARLKQRIAHVLIEEIVADIDEDKAEVVLVVHWAGGRHTTVRVPRRKAADRSRYAHLDAVEVVRRMAPRWPDGTIALALNNLKLRTAAGHPWSESSVREQRQQQGAPQCPPTSSQPSTLTIQQAATLLGVSSSVVLRLMKTRILPATQVVSMAPWEIEPESLRAPQVLAEVATAKRRRRPRRRQTITVEGLLFPTN